jgi:predicted ATPase
MYQTANGIKMFGFLQILILNGTLKKGSTLIFDEPEVHLHPSWQLEYAKMICSIVAEGIKVLVNSHSPYMIEALELFSKKEHINSHFYLAHQVDEASIIENVSNHLERIYKKLAEPLSRLEELEDA